MLFSALFTEIVCTYHAWSLWETCKSFNYITSLYKSLETNPPEFSIHLWPE